MSIQQIPLRVVPTNRVRAIAHTLTAGIATLGVVLLAACGGGSSDPGGGDATLSGTVTAAASSSALAGAIVTVGARQATTDANGRFEVTGVATGTAIARARRAGYVGVDATVTIAAGANTHDFTLSAQEAYVSDAYAMYVPTGVETLRGVIVTLGDGVTTSGFVTGGNLEGNGELERSLQAMGANLRLLAQSAHVALFGTTNKNMANIAASDNDILASFPKFAELSGHPELTNAPMLTFGLSGGSSEAVGLALRHPERAIGVLMRVPPGVPAVTAAAELAIPMFIMQAAQDEYSDNAAVLSTFLANRSRGALWSLAVEPGVGHAVASDRGNAANVGWLAEALSRRLPATPGGPLTSFTESAGWLGNQATRDIAAWADYAGNRATASWLISSSAALGWKDLGAP